MPFKMIRNDITRVRAYAEGKGYDLSCTCDEIRPSYHHVESCQETVPEAISAFLEGMDFEDVIRTAVSFGGDCDTLTCIAGSMAEAFYDVPVELKAECEKRLPEDMKKVLYRFNDIYKSHTPARNMEDYFFNIRLLYAAGV